MQEHFDERGREASDDVLGRITLLDALLLQPVTIHRLHARQVLEVVADNELSRWNRHPLRDGAQAVALIDQTLKALGFAPGTQRYSDPHRRRGGWSVSSRKTSR